VNRTAVEDGELVSTPVKAIVVLLPGPRETTVVSDTVLWPVTVGSSVVTVSTLLLPPPMPMVVVRVTFPLPPLPPLLPPAEEVVEVMVELVAVEVDVVVMVVPEVVVDVDVDVVVDVVVDEVDVPLIQPTGYPIVPLG